MNHFGLLHNRPPSPFKPFFEIDGDSLTDAEISWEDKVENDIYLHAMMDFVNHGKQQRHQASNAVPMLFQRAVTRPTKEAKPGFWDAFFPKEKECPIPTVIYIEHESTNPYKKQKHVNNLPFMDDDDEGYYASDEEITLPGSVSPSLRSELWTIHTQSLCEEDVVEVLGLRRIGREHWNGTASHFADVTFRAPEGVAEPPNALPRQHPWDRDEARRHESLADKKLCGVEYLNFGYF